MQEIAATLNRLSIAVQFAMVFCLFGYFLLLWQMVKLREVRLWTLAWLADAVALAAVFIHVYAAIPPFGHRITLVLYLAGKATFAILIVSGARRHLRPGVEPRMSPLFFTLFIATWSLILGLAVPSLWQGQLAESALVGVVLLGGGITVLRHPRSSVSRWLGWAMLVEGVLFLHSAALLVPALWGNHIGFAYLNYSSFFDAWAELMLALACIAVIADRREELLHYANRELLQSQQRLSRLVDTDPLTNLSNRRSLRKSMNSVIDTGGSFIFIDINNFKQVNDLFGHRVGDTTLQRLANLVVEQFRPEDHVIRWGGDEFLVVAPKLDQVSAKARVAAIREALKHPTNDCPPFSIAAGIAELFPGGDPAAALEEADRRMFAESGADSVSDRFHPLPLEVLSAWIADELDAKDSVFGIPRSLFFSPGEHGTLESTVYGHALEAPLGVAAGPHSQLAQNIVVAWLCGARFIELKTVQTLDQIEVSKPCIDMQDEGYNVEWSQELRVEESFTEYLNAWVLIHALHRRLGFPGEDPGLIFNLSVGYDLAGIRQPNMQWFLDKVEDPGDDLRNAVKVVSRRWPEAAEHPIQTRMSDNVTLSTMHGCPPDEIGAISSYLLSDRGLHTSVKLNPTLLGPERLRPILSDRLGFKDLMIPDKVFEEDLDYTDALSLLQELSDTAISRELVFGVKLTNTLAVTNHRRVFDPSEDTMYLSGRPLHALTVQLAHCLAEDVEHPLMMSFSGGADAHNMAPLIRSGMKTITVCSDLLRPGGNLRFGQYVDQLEESMDAVDAGSIDAFVRSGGTNDEQSAEEIARANLRDYADAVLSAPAYHQETFDRSHTKTSRRLGLFDCIVAPCTDGCDVDQQVPEYMRRVAAGDNDGAAEITRLDNPLASILGRTCHHPCEPVCLRTHMDQPLAIREIKRYITDHERPPSTTVTPILASAKVAVIGGGPCGLGAATFLARAGIAVTIFEARPASGGMVSATIPDYRAATHAVNRDLDHLRALGVEVRHNQEVGRNLSLESLRTEGFSSIVIAVGARHGLRLGIEGEESHGVLDGLDFLRAARDGEPPTLGKKIGVIGGGDVAMDCSRTACRLADGEVTVFYRRTRSEMPAQKEELLDLFEEGGKLEELMSPRRAIATDGRLRAVEMAVMQLGEPDDSGRRRPEPIPRAECTVELDTLIVAIGQRPDLSLFGDEAVQLSSSGYLEVDPATLETSIPDVYAGGDIIDDGPSNIVKACGDGRIIADAIIARHQKSPATTEPATDWPAFDDTELLRRRARVEPRVEIPHLEPDQRRGFAEVIITLPQADAKREASRCLDCDIMCSTCDSVCPNRAIFTYHVQPQQLSIPQLRFEDGELVTGDAIEFEIRQGPQVAVLTDACNECGNCVTFCPTSDRPWRDKPRLYLDRDDFEAETDNAFMLIRSDGARGLHAKFGGALHQLIVEDGLMRYTSPVVELSMDQISLTVLKSAVRGRPSDRQLLDPDCLGAMMTLDRAFADSMPEFPLVDAKPIWLIGGSTDQPR